MPRYFIEVTYKGTAYAGFQIQQNANTIQAEVEKALSIYYKELFQLTGSSRTDAGVHAIQNFFHFDTNILITAEQSTKSTYHINAILPKDIVVKSIKAVANDAHARFDAIARTYQYDIYNSKNPFIDETAFYYPYLLNEDLMQKAASLLLTYTNYESFSKKNTQVFTYECTIMESKWTFSENLVKYNVKGSRFLRGMVRGLVGTMLLVGRGKYSIDDFIQIIESKSSSKTDFSVPAKGLTLIKVQY